MITPIIRQILIDSGCTMVVYESENLSNIHMDRSDQADIIGHVIQPDQMTLEVKANSILEHYAPYYIEVMQQVKSEDTADNNELILEAMKEICKQVIVRVIMLSEFKSLTSTTLTKITERRYDANVLGWRMPMDLTFLKNETKYPCTTSS